MTLYYQKVGLFKGQIANYCSHGNETIVQTIQWDFPTSHRMEEYTNEYRSS